MMKHKFKVMEPFTYCCSELLRLLYEEPFKCSITEWFFTVFIHTKDFEFFLRGAEQYFSRANLCILLKIKFQPFFTSIFQRHD